MGLKREMADDTLLLLSEGDVILQLAEKIEGDTVSIEAGGSLRSDTAQDLQDEMMTFLLAKKNIVLSLEKATYLSVGCIQVLIELQQKIDRMKRGSLKLKKIPPSLLKELERIGADELLDIEE